MAPECGKIFAKGKNLDYHYSQGHAGEKRNRSPIAFPKLFQTIEFDGGQETKISEQRPIEEAGWQRSREKIVEVRRCKERRPITSANPLQPTQTGKYRNRKL
jgi:hypothetical protein